MWKIKGIYRSAIQALFGCICLALSTGPAHANPRLVFATYMMCCPLLGNDQTVDDYKREIAQAKAAGIDGFGVDVSYWPKVRRASTNVDRLFDAADQSNFKLFIVADQGNPKGGLTTAQFMDLLLRFGNRPSYYKYEGKAFVSTYMGEANWISQIRKLAFRSGNPIYLVPYLGLRNRSALNAFADDPRLSVMIPKLSDIDGYFSFFAYGSAAHQRDIMEKLSKALKASGKTYMPGLVPYYRRASPRLWVDDGQGMSKIISGLNAANDLDAEWVQIGTWNDWAESTYVQPFTANEVDSGTGRWKGLLNHGPMLTFLAPFIRMYKTGMMETPSRDQAILMYRPALKQALCGADTADVRLQRRRDPALEALDDRVYLAVLLERPATLKLTVAGNTIISMVDSGYKQIDMPARAGSVSARIVRNGVTVLQSVNTKPISATDTSPCFNIYSSELR